MFFFAVKKAYYKLSLLVHPDRVSEAEKDVATEKFKILTKVHAILTDKDKKALYDEQGIIDDDGDGDVCWTDLWRQFFQPITTTDIDNFKNTYIGECLELVNRNTYLTFIFIRPGSDMEKRDIKKAYLNGSGCINYMIDFVPFMAVEDEPRIMEIVKGKTL